MSLARKNDSNTKIKEYQKTIEGYEKTINDLLTLIKEDESKHDTEKSNLLKKIYDLEHFKQSLIEENLNFLEDKDMEEFKAEDYIRLIKIEKK